MPDMDRLHAVITEEVAKMVAGGEDERAAFASAMHWLLANAPHVFAAYSAYLERRAQFANAGKR